VNDYVVVIPTRNRYRLCLRAIRSALTQTVPPAEVFVVDDASDDPRYQWLEEIVGSPRLTVLRRAVSSREETEAGFAVGTVRNDAIRHVLKIGFSGWVAFLDDDDEWVGIKAAVQFDAVGSNGRYGVLCSNAFNRDIGGVVSGYHHVSAGAAITDTTRDVTAICRAMNPVINSTAMIHTKIVERLGDQQPAGFGEDWDYWQRASRLTGIMRVEEPLAWYTVGNPKEYTL
jgi:glycosyltransferase involved in cell wall biosynthesis